MLRVDYFVVKWLCKREDYFRFPTEQNNPV